MNIHQLIIKSNDKESIKRIDRKFENKDILFYSESNQNLINQIDIFFLNNSKFFDRIEFNQEIKFLREMI